ncbi:hypothetical protein NFI96_030953 [Prochilodus magdalenae]|nr:hypothetical protein NFI96_030953 [Prochilodus magdalenae]
MGENSRQISNPFCYDREMPSLYLQEDQCSGLDNNTGHCDAYDPPHFWPANIFGGGTAEAGKDDRDVSNSVIHMYLCKDGGGVMMEPLVDTDEYTFTLRKVTRDSGSYSCVYSINKYPAKNVTASGQNSVYIHVIGKR